MSRRREKRQTLLREKFGDKCSICGDTYYLQIHRKDGKKHKKVRDMSNAEFNALMNGDNFAQLCFNCHKAVHWCMEYLGLLWNDLETKIHISGKNKYHS